MSEKTVEIPQSDRIVAVPVPEGGFTPAQIENLMRRGFRVWGIVPIATNAPQTDLVVPGHVSRPVNHLVLDRDVSTVPLNLLAHHIVQAKKEKQGLNHLSMLFFGLTLEALVKARDDAERRFNEQG